MTNKIKLTKPESDRILTLPVNHHRNFEDLLNRSTETDKLLTPFTRYEIKSVDQLREILDTAKKEGYKIHVDEDDFSIVYHLHIHGSYVNWCRGSSHPYYHYSLVTWEGVKKDVEYKYEEVKFEGLIEMLEAIRDEDIYLGSSLNRYSLLEYDGKVVKEGGFYPVPSEDLLKKHLCRLVEIPWWEKHVGGLVMARDSDEEEWYVEIFRGWSDETVYHFCCEGGNWKQMRPLTQAEKDAIITEG